MERIVGKKSAAIDPNRGIDGVSNRLAIAPHLNQREVRTAAETQRTRRIAQVKTGSCPGKGHDRANVRDGSGNTRRTMAVRDGNAGMGER